MKSNQKISAALTATTIIAILLSTATSARAQINFPSFSPGNIGVGASQVTLNGTSILSGSTIQLTDTSIGQAGTAFYNTRQSLLSGFSTTFNYSITGQGVFGIADGLAFLASNDPSGVTALGNGGSDVGFIGLVNTLAIKVDTFEAQTPDIGIHVLDGSGNEFAYAPLTYAQVSGTHDVTINFQNALGGVGNLDVFFDNTPTISLAVFDINPYVNGGGTSYTGFSAGTGLFAENHNINSWLLQPGNIAPAPEPTTLGLFVFGGIGILARQARRRNQK
jgi:Legume lectin domain/PEP-CTERM motif